MTVHSDWNEGTCLTGGWKHWDCSIRRTEGSGAILAMGRNAWRKDIRKTAKFLSVVSSRRGKGYSMFLFKLKKKVIFLWGCQTVVQAAQWGCGVFASEQIQPCWCSPAQPALAGTPASRALDKAFPEVLSTSTAPVLLSLSTPQWFWS